MRGRPKGTNIRKNISWIIKHMGYSYGYEILRNYNLVFGPIKMRTLYYNLRSGISSGEFVVMDIRREVGNYTWGSETERVYYTIGPYAQFSKLKTSEKYNLNSLKINKMDVDMNSSILSQINKFEGEIQEFLERREKLDVSLAEHSKQKILLKSGKLKQWCNQMQTQNNYLNSLKKINELTVKL